MCILAQCFICVLLVDFRWPVNTWLRISVLEAQADGAAVCVTWPFFSGLASDPLPPLLTIRTLNFLMVLEKIEQIFES